MDQKQDEMFDIGAQETLIWICFPIYQVRARIHSGADNRD